MATAPLTAGAVLAEFRVSAPPPIEPIPYDSVCPLSVELASVPGFEWQRRHGWRPGPTDFHATGPRS